MDIAVCEPKSWLARSAIARGCNVDQQVGALRAGDAAPTYYIENEVVVDAEDHDLIERMTAMGGVITRPAHDPELPPEFRRAGLGREQPVDMAGVPRSVRISFDTVPDSGDVHLSSVLARADDIEADQFTFSSPRARALAAMVAPMAADGRRVWLNHVGVDYTLPLRNPTEGAGLNYSADPLSWPSMTGPARIAQAWQLLETLRKTRSASPVVFIAVCDSGFWFDASGPAGSPADHEISDLGRGLIRWDAVADRAGIPAGAGRKSWHGTKVASAAGATVGNSRGAAGAGGTVARLCYFFDDRTDDSAKTTMIRCTQWGIPFVVYSGSFTSNEFFFGTSEWNQTFNWAADNGTIMIAAAGNDKLHLPDDAVVRPATRTPRAITVGATEDDGSKAGFSNWGTSVDIWAPGVGIPVVPVPDPPRTGPAGEFVSGTSIAAPLVAGVAAMIRAANPALSVDEIRATLYDTAWPGEGVVTQGLDAYAAVWAAMRDHMAEDVTEGKGEQLYPEPDGSFRPIFGDAINRVGDSDTFYVDVDGFSTLRIELQWYDLLSTVSLMLENTDPERNEPNATISKGPGRVTLTAQIGSGRYRIRVSGGGPTAYVLSGKITRGRLSADRFERNNSFATATRLRLTPRTPWEPRPMLGGAWGPGTFSLTLHTAPKAPTTTDEDYFWIDVPSDIVYPSLPQIRIGSDELVQVRLFDNDELELKDFGSSRDHTVNLPTGQSVYVNVRGKLHTRYELWAGIGFDGGVFGKLWPEVKKFPDWWVMPPEHPDWVTDPMVLRAIELDDATVRAGALTVLETLGTADARVEILRPDDSGEVLVSADPSTGVLDLSGVEPGTYLVRVRSDASPSRPILLSPNVPAPIPG